jgi:ADP-ribose pyrophosphatase YjhB (NUDIX family)
VKRRRVVAYVTREHPATGADQLLVFEEDDELHVPAGGIEADETLEQAAAREVREETGLNGIRVLREVGVLEQPGREPSFVHESHFVQATPTVESADHWHHGVVRCRWEAVRSELQLWAPHAAFLPALLRRRVVAYVTRRRDGCTELLTIEYRHLPDVPPGLPAGRIDADEGLEAGLKREVAEETGVTGLSDIRELAGPDEFERLFGAVAHPSHAFHAVCRDEGPREWEHAVTGDGSDAGLVHVCRWVRLDERPSLWGRSDPLVEKLRRSLAQA